MKPLLPGHGERASAVVLSAARRACPSAPLRIAAPVALPPTQALGIILIPAAADLFCPTAPPEEDSLLGQLFQRQSATKPAVQLRFPAGRRVSEGAHSTQGGNYACSSRIVADVEISIRPSVSGYVMVVSRPDDSDRLPAALVLRHTAATVGPNQCLAPTHHTHSPAHCG